MRTGRLRPRAEEGFTLIELVVVMAILIIVLIGIADIFVSGTNSEIDQNNRVQAQQQVRTGLDKMRRELHCATSVSPNGGSWPAKAVTVVLGDYCPSFRSGTVSVTWCAGSTSGAAPYKLWRYPHTTDLTGGTYAAACTDTGSGGVSWASNIVDYGVVTGAQSGFIFRSYSTPTNPAMGPPFFSITAGGTLGSAVADASYGYIVDAVTAGPTEQPGTESVVTLAQGTTSRNILVDWSASVPSYPVIGYRLYGRTAGNETYMCSTVTAETPQCTSATTELDTGSVALGAGTPVPSALSSVTVDIPVRFKKNGGKVGVAELTDQITLRNTAQ